MCCGKGTGIADLLAGAMVVYRTAKWGSFRVSASFRLRREGCAPAPRSRAAAPIWGSVGDVPDRGGLGHGARVLRTASSLHDSTRLRLVGGGK